MKIYWWQGGIHIESETEIEHQAMKILWSAQRIDSDGNMYHGETDVLNARVLTDVSTPASTSGSVEHLPDDVLSD
jgi:hypothetical protein